MKRTLISLIGLISLICPIGLHADVVAPSSIDADTTWSPDNGVYILNSRTTIPAGKTLTIAPGTVIKGFGDIFVNGSLSAEGTSDNPIVFTSERDDGISGDTNGDASSTLPAVGDWNGIIFGSGSTGSFSYTQVLYAGNAGIGRSDAGIRNEDGAVTLSHVILDHDGDFPFYNHLGSFSVTGSEMRSGNTGILIEGGSGTVTNSILSDNSQFGLQDTAAGSALVLTGNTFSNNGTTANLDVSVSFTHSGNISTDAHNRAFRIGGTLTGDYTLNSDDLPTVVFGQFSVPAGKTLTLTPGAIIKFGPGHGLSIDGSLVTQGTANNPVKLTSIKDDAIDGDTNNDGNATSPTPNDNSDNWTGVAFNSGSTGNLSHTEFHYGGTFGPIGNQGAQLYNFGASLTLDQVTLTGSFQYGFYQSSGTTTGTDLTITDNTTGVQSLGGTLTISNSIIGPNHGFNMMNQAIDPVDLRNNWWGAADGPNNISTSTPTGSGDRISGNILYDPWLTEEPVFNATSSNSGSGSGSTSTPNTLYGTSTPVIIVPGILGSAQQDGIWVIDPILHTYDNLIDTLVANGYTLGINLFTFPYDWRVSNVSTAGLLKLKINEVRNICHCDKVNIVAHSMGGLVAQYYAESPAYDDDINQLIFLGTPHRGAPEDYLPWEAGRLSPGIYNQLLSLVLSHQAHENGYLDLYSYIKNFPIVSIQQLLPVDSYLKNASTNFFKIYPTGYPQNTFLESLNSNVSTLLNSNIRIKNYIGNIGTSTITTVRVTDSPNPLLWNDGYPEDFDSQFGDHGLENGPGDGTVPVVSASLSTTTDSIVGSSHINLPSALSGSVYQDLVGSTTDQVVSRSAISRVLVASVMSPADIEVIAPDGKKTGWDQESGRYLNEIPGAFFSGTNNEEEYITVPDPLDGEYKVNATGKNGGGSYTVLASNVSDGQEQTVQHVGTILTNQTVSHELTVTADSVSQISVPSDQSDRSVTSDGLLPGTGRRPIVNHVPLVKPAATPTKIISNEISNPASKEADEVAPSINTANTAAAYNALSPKTEGILHKVGKWISGFFKRLFGSKIKQ